MIDIASALEELITTPAALVTLGLVIVLADLLKAALARYWPATVDSSLKSHLMPLVPVAFGLLFALIPSWLPGESFGPRAVVGCAIGLLAPWFYGALKPRKKA